MTHIPFYPALTRKPLLTFGHQSVVEAKPSSPPAADQFNKGEEFAVTDSKIWNAFVKEYSPKGPADQSPAIQYARGFAKLVEQELAQNPDKPITQVFEEASDQPWPGVKRSEKADAQYALSKAWHYGPQFATWMNRMWLPAKQAEALTKKGGLLPLSGF